MHKYFALFFATLLLAALFVPAISLAGGGDSKDELKERFAQRYPELLKLKAAGTIGETFQGFVEVVKAGDAAAKEILAAENADRATLYRIIAKEQETTPEKVAARNAQRNFANAPAGEWLKHPDGQWRKKA